MYQDETLVCEDCGAQFVFTAGEQEFYAEKGLVNKPKRCPECRRSERSRLPCTIDFTVMCQRRAMLDSVSPERTR